MVRSAGTLGKSDEMQPGLAEENFLENGQFSGAMTDGVLKYGWV